MDEIKTLTLRVIKRFARGFITGAVGMASVVTLVVPGSWSDFYAMLSTLLLSFIVGGVSGGLQALDLYLRNLPKE